MALQHQTEFLPSWLAQDEIYRLTGNPTDQEQALLRVLEIPRRTRLPKLNSKTCCVSPTAGSKACWTTEEERRVPKVFHTRKKLCLVAQLFPVGVPSRIRKEGTMTGEGVYDWWLADTGKERLSDTPATPCGVRRKQVRGSTYGIPHLLSLTSQRRAKKVPHGFTGVQGLLRFFRTFAELTKQDCSLELSRSQLAQACFSRSASSRPRCSGVRESTKLCIRSTAPDSEPAFWPSCEFPVFSRVLSQ
jgi:hypothetical protein